MGYEGDKINSYLSNLIIKKTSNDCSHSKKAIFCEGEKSLVVCHGKSCHLYNSSTGNHVKELFKSKSNIISHHLHPLEKSLLITVTENGEVTVFNLKTNEMEHITKLIINHSLLKSKKVSKFDLENETSNDSTENEHEEQKEFDWEQEHVNSLAQRKFLYAETKVFQGNPSNIFIWASWHLKDEVKAHLSVFSLQDGKHQSALSFRKFKLKISYANFILSKLQDLDMFVGLSDHYLYVVRFENKNSFYYTTRKHCTGLNNKLTSVAIHPTQYSIATGDSIGRITVWENIFDKYPLKETFHWHSSAVGDIHYSNFGNYIFSGGEENVLVKWSIVAGKKQFLPRLSGAICHISESSESLLSVVTSDSRILILDLNFQSVATIQSFSHWCTQQDVRTSNVFTVDPRTNSVVLRGKVGHIQFVSPKEEGKLMYLFDVTNRNFINSHSTCTVTNTEVTHVVFSSTGEWMITAESRRENECKESRIKFWKFISEKGSYTLNTNVEFPHGDDEIHCLEISPDGMVATTGPDKRFRLWTLDEYQVGSSVKEIWSVHSDRKYRHLPCKAVDFSKDSSLVAVTFGSILTIWETNTCLLKCSLSSPNCKDPLKVCKFGNNEMTHLVVTGTEAGLFCWNTITLALVWSVPVALSLLVSDPFSIHMVSFSRGNTLIVFNPASPTPNLVLRNVCDSPVVAACCALLGSGKLSLHLLTQKQELFTLTGEDEIEEAVAVEENEGSFVTPYAAHIAQIQYQPEMSRKKSVSVMKNNQKFVSDLLNSPAHTLSNPSLLCSQVLKSLLLFSVGKHYPMGQLRKGTRREEHRDSANLLREVDKLEAEMNENGLINIVETIFT
ncbi:hypothetical protein RUM43_014531 [Polyplax serrata]|uniref:WD repeat-containing protein 75 second beta-propeller domain-containing protein n=1 Tax=Polyplax serrata TaxID=468196 RepID=A0AAN8P3W9_POLSC